jgi:hypothetical protein
MVFKGRERLSRGTTKMQGLAALVRNTWLSLE